jgi:hypothetical protein
MRFDEFNEFIENRRQLETLHPIPRLLEDFTLEAKPILGVCLATSTDNLGVRPEGHRTAVRDREIGRIGDQTSETTLFQ